MQTDNENRAVEILEALQILHEPGEVVELRIPGARRGTVAGYFNNMEELAKTACNWDGGAPGIYTTLNPVNQDLLERAPNRTIDRPANATTDEDIIKRRWLPLDFDPIRSSGISSTDEEHNAALERARKVKEWLTGQDWPEPVYADSGNGAHLLYRVDLPNDNESRELIEGCLRAVAAYFSDETVEVDTGVGNSGRIWKLYGTTACKGEAQPDRPHRCAEIIEGPEVVSVVPTEKLIDLMSTVFVQVDDDEDSGGGTNGFDLDKWIEEHNVPVGPPRPWKNGARKWVFDLCPWEQEHNNKSAFIVQFSNGAIAAGCHHTSCQGKGWHDLRDVYEPGWREKKTKTPEDGNGEGTYKRSQADVLVGLASEATYYHDDINQPFAVVDEGDYHMVMHCENGIFKKWLQQLYFKHNKKVPSSEAVKQAREQLAGMALLQGEQREVFLRVGEHENFFWYDLADNRWRAIKVGPEGWEIVTKPPILFTRYPNTKEQVEPKRVDGELARLLKYVNLKNEADRNLFLVYVVSCLIPRIPHTVANFYGEKGAAKSTAMKVLRRLVDPAGAELLELPVNSREMAITLSHNYMPAFDNLERILVWQSNALCRASTGGAINMRILYTTDDELILEFLRCVALNGINLTASRADLLDRSVLFELDRIKEENRKEEAEFWAEFEEDRPYILGGMFDTLSQAMRLYPDVKLRALPRMADFCRWGYAIAEAIGIGGEKFLREYRENVGQGNQEAINSNVVASAVMAFMRDKANWEGTMAQFMGELQGVTEQEKIDTRSKDWPKRPNHLSARMKHVKSNLEDVGITYENGSYTKGELKGHSFIRIQRPEGMLVESQAKNTDIADSQAVGQQAVEQTQAGGDAGGDNVNHLNPAKCANIWDYRPSGDGGDDQGQTRKLTEDDF